MKNIYKPPAPIKVLRKGLIPSKGITSSRLWSFLKTINFLYEDNISDNSILFFENVGLNFDRLKSIEFKPNDFLVVDDTYEGLLTQEQVDYIISLGIDYAICSSNENLFGDNVYFFSFHLLYKDYDNIKVQNPFSVNLEKRENIFLSLNRQTRTHRLKLVSYLAEKDLLEKSIVSCDYIELHNIENNDILEDNLELLTPKEINTLTEILPLRLDDTNNVKHLPDPSTFYQNSYWSLIGERDFYSDVYVGWTEKVLKSFLFYHPFIVVGLPFTLESLKSFGFKTFDNYIDESYDTITDHHKRFNSIKEQIDRLAEKTIDEHHKIYQDMLPLLEYNHNLYKDINLRYGPTELMDQLTKAKLK